MRIVIGIDKRMASAAAKVLFEPALPRRRADEDEDPLSVGFLLPDMLAAFRTAAFSKALPFA